MGALFPGPNGCKNGVNDDSVSGKRGRFAPHSDARINRTNLQRFPPHVPERDRPSVHCHLPNLMRSFCHAEASAPRRNGCAVHLAPFNLCCIGPARPRRSARGCSCCDAPCRAGDAPCRCSRDASRCCSRDAACRTSDAAYGAGHAARLGCAAHGPAAHRCAAAADGRTSHRGAGKKCTSHRCARTKHGDPAR